jgi:LPXTG-motif cell wall-anchored protein
MYKKIMCVALVGILLIILSINSFATNAVELTSIISSDMDFDKCKIVLGTDYKEIFDNAGELETKTIPVSTIDEGKIRIKVKIKECGWFEIYNNVHDLVDGDNLIEINHIDCEDKKINLKINIYYLAVAASTTHTATATTHTETLTPTATEVTITPTTEPTNTIIPTETQNVTVSPTQQTNQADEELPQTGEASTLLFGIVSVIFMGTGGTLLLLKNKQKN